MKHRLVILGGGESGVGAALLAKQKGYEVFLSDESSLKEIYRNELQNAGIVFEEGRHTDEKILNADYFTISLESITEFDLTNDPDLICPASCNRSQTTVCSRDQQFPVG